LSRLDSFIRRLEAQRACLDRAASLVRDLPGAVFELGLGNGRTYDHLREVLPEREIYVFDRRVAAHPQCIPPAERLVLGELRETLPGLHRRFAGAVALAHMDVATGEVEPSLALAAEVLRLLLPLMRQGGIVVSEPPLRAAALAAEALPAAVAPGRYHLYRVTEITALP
jgi:S-adenosyl-L-methionine methyltransferase